MSKTHGHFGAKNNALIKHYENNTRHSLNPFLNKTYSASSSPSGTRSRASTIINTPSPVKISNFNNTTAGSPLAIVKKSKS